MERKLKMLKFPLPDNIKKEIEESQKVEEVNIKLLQEKLKNMGGMRLVFKGRNFMKSVFIYEKIKILS
jgi:hypothetical protein